jgi:hypothetical protein
LPERATLNNLEAANNRLLELRAQAQVARQAAASPSQTPQESPFVNCQIEPGQLSKGTIDQAPGTAVTVIEPGSPQTAVSWQMRNAIRDVNLRRGHTVNVNSMTGVTVHVDSDAIQTAVTVNVNSEAIPSGSQAAVTVNVDSDIPRLKRSIDASPLPLEGPTIRVYPDIANGLDGSIYRLYLACQLLDSTGSGLVMVDELRQTFTDQDNGRYLFGWKRMRQVLAAGHGRAWFYVQDEGKLFLRGVYRVAVAAGLRRVGRPVALPAGLLFAGEGVFNAHMHAAWLSARGDETRPISQASISQLTAVPDRTQRHYNHVAGVQRQRNIDIGERHTERSEEEHAWQHGRNSFEFVDYTGRHGRPGGHYRARLMPDSYKRRHPLAAGGRRRKINKTLKASLVVNEERGNAGGNVDRIYFSNGSQAAKTANRRPGDEVYWQSSQKAGGYQVWHGIRV